MFLRAVSFFLLLMFGLNMPASWAVLEPLASDKGLEISDRNYYGQLRRLLRSATTSIDVSMEKIVLTDEPQDPVHFLLEDLITAKKRGVLVRLFLNTGGEDFQFLHENVLENLRRESVDVHFVNPEYQLHDRLVIIDGEWILEGGVTWTREDLEKGLGSATLTPSKEMAQRKRIRLELLPLWDVAVRKAERSEGRIPVPLYLLQEVKFFPSMINADDGDAMKVYLRILRNFHAAQNMEYWLRLEEIAQEMPSERSMEAHAATMQALKVLQRLEKEYGLIKILSQEPDRVQIQMLLPEKMDPLVGVPVSFFTENYAKELSATAIFAYFVILYRAQVSGESPVWLGSARNVEQDFPLPSEKFKAATEQLRRANLIEIFPFRLQAGVQPSSERECRYLLNVVPSLSGRLAAWDQMREQYGEEPFIKARRIADAFGDPEDPKVITAFLELMKKFPYDDIFSLTQQLADLDPESTASRLEYIRSRLEHESRPLGNLAV